MSLSAGTRLGPYEIVGIIGAGGMGEVYKARDTRLNRIVALKVSKDQFSERFEREARAVAALNHPNICTLHDVGPNYLVMEFVEGEDLTGPLPLETAIKYARQIIDAIEAAHDKGIIHRDLKPGNIKISPEGQVKVLDFGLAKATEESPISRTQDSPTLSMAATRAGVILGTAAYMPPEQARGKPADRRADIWSFGVVFYEMLTGERPFRGENPSEIMASVIKEEPRLDGLPVSLRPLIARCLTKEPRQRLQAIGEARIALESSLEKPQPSPAAPSRSRRGIVPWAMTGVAAALALAIIHFREAPPERRIVRFDIPAPEKNVPAMFHLSPDGRYLAFGGADDGAAGRLWVRSLDSVQTQSIPGTEGARYPFWSPDSASIGFFAQGKVKRVAVSGGPVQTICDAANGRGGSWNRDGVIVFSPGPNSPLQRVAAAGGEASLVSKNDDPQASYRFPEFLPDGHHFLLMVGSNKSENAGIYVGSLDGTPRIRLRPEASNALYTPSSAGGDGLLLFRKDNTLMAQPFDPVILKTKGDIFAVTEQVGEAGNTGFGAFSVSDAGVLAHATGQGGTVRELAWVDRKGKRMDTVTKPAPIGDFALGPDEKRAVIRLDDKNNTSDFWLQDLIRGTLSRFTFGAQSVTNAVWSPDGNRVAYAASPASSFSYDLYQKTAGGGKEELLAHAGVNARPTDWSRDGKSIVFVVLGEKTNYDLWLLPVDSAGGKPAIYVQTPFSERAARFSPDGHFMAYESDESGQDEVYVQPIPASGAKWQVSNAGGRQPTWRSDGKELYFIAGQKLIAVATKTDTSGFQAGTAEPLFDGPRADDFDSVYQPSANGQRFLVRFAAGDVNSAAPTTIVLNWQAGVKK